MREPELAHKEGSIWKVNIRKLSEIQNIDLVELLLILQSPTTSLVKATTLSRTSGLPRRTIAHWCKTRPGFAIQIGHVWFVDLAHWGVTPEELASRCRNLEQETSP